MRDDRTQAFLTMHYGTLSGLWARRDDMRGVYLKFYFLFLGAVLSVTGFLSRDAIDTVSARDLLSSSIVRGLFGVGFLVGLLTFVMLQYIRMHNLRCIYDMTDIADWFDSDADVRYCRDLVGRHKTRVRATRGVDFTTSLLVGTVNSALAASVFVDTWYGVCFGILGSLIVHGVLWYTLLQQHRLKPPER